MQKFENITKINFLKESRELQQNFNKYSDLKEKSAKIIIGLQGYTDNKSLKNLTITENNFCEKINCLFTILSKYLGVNSIKIQEEIV